jgi:hypothetical protein
VPLTAEDMMAFQQLVARYNFAIDGGDGEAFSRCFVPDGRFSYSDGDVIEGAAALAEFGSSLARLGPIRHVVTSFLMEGGGDRASCRSYCQVFAVDGQGGSYVLSHGVYHDTLVHVDGNWRFEERRYVIDPGAPRAG